MVFTPRDITETELALLRVLWESGPTTIRKLTDAMYEEGTHSQYATVQSLLGRLEDKACVTHQRRGRVNVFTATVSRGDVIARRLRGMAESLCDGSLSPLLSHLVDHVELSDEEVDTLKTLVERLDQGENDGSDT